MLENYAATSSSFITYLPVAASLLQPVAASLLQPIAASLHIFHD